MYQVTLFLLPAVVFGILSFGFQALFVVVASIVSAVVTEAVIQKIRGVAITIDDGSAILTGLLLAMSLPPSVPLYIPIISSALRLAL